jgi:hypothetical protein
MTKAELIEKLREFPDDAPVYFFDSDRENTLEPGGVSLEGDGSVTITCDSFGPIWCDGCGSTNGRILEYKEGTYHAACHEEANEEAS